MEINKALRQHTSQGEGMRQGFSLKNPPAGENRQEEKDELKDLLQKLSLEKAR